MKNARVNNMKTAVAVTSSSTNSVKGIMYKYPENIVVSTDVVRERLKKANNNFVIINPIKQDETKVEIKKLRDPINNKFKDILQNNGENLNLSVLLQELTIFFREQKSAEWTLDNLNYLIDNRYLRNALSLHGEGCKILFEAAYKEKQNVYDVADPQNKKDEKKRLVEDFIDHLVLCYTKKNPKNKNENSPRSKKSIEHQNMVVQPNEDGIILPSRNRDNNRKQNEKEGLNAFLMQFSSTDGEKRNALLLKLRYLLMLYFATPDSVQNLKCSDINKEIGKYAESLKEITDNKENDIWKLHEEGKKDENYFVETSGESEDKFCDAITLKKRVQKKNASCYRFSTVIVDSKEYSKYFFDNNINHFWIHHIADAVNRILCGENRRLKKYSKYRYNIGYLRERVWKDCLNLLSIKYTAIGKRVYASIEGKIDSFMEDNYRGKIDLMPIFDKDYSSFDYEMISTKEKLQRDVATYVAFAANNFARATVNIDKDNCDVLLWKDNDFIANCKYKTSDGEPDYDKELTTILQFWDGRSKWKSESLKKLPQKTIWSSMKGAIYSLRNSTFHFTSKKQGTWEYDFFDMLEHDKEMCAIEDIRRLYSNNLDCFYNVKDLEEVYKKLYSEIVSRKSQIPAFNNVFNKGKFSDVIENIINDEKTIKQLNNERKKWENALYYLFKEIYYNDFLPNIKINDVKDEFNELESRPNYICGGDCYWAFISFSRRFNELVKLGFSFSDICQTIMTDYNYQNNQIRKVVDNKTKHKNDQELYTHYKLILEELIRECFFKFINDNEELYGFIAKPSVKYNEQNYRPSEDDFTNKKWGNSERYNGLLDKFKNNPEMQQWYVVAHFLNGKSINLLAGSVRSFIQYVGDVQKRAEINKNTIVFYNDYSELAKRLEEDILPILDLCQRLSSTVSNEITDYFDPKDDYDIYLKNYIVFNKSDTINNEEYKKKLKETGVFYDAKNPIVNKNIIFSKLFGPWEIVSNIKRPVSDDDIEALNELDEKISNYKSTGKYSNIEEHTNVIAYQRLKNRIECTDVVEYSEIINELLAQLVSYSYLRERDLLYYQLGFHYLCLNNGGEDTAYRKIVNDEKTMTINGAILYQIIAMYIYGVKIFYCYNGKWKKNSGNLQTSGKIEMFKNYAEHLFGDSEKLYFAGMELFEKTKEHDDIIDLRNYIDHMVYYSGNRSILDLYSEVFDRFFVHDMKYKTNLPDTLKNILARHFVFLDLNFMEGEKVLTIKNEESIAFTSIPSAKIDIKDCSVYADYFTLKYKGDIEGNINEKGLKMEHRYAAHDKNYLECLTKILYYPNNREIDVFKKVSTQEILENKEENSKKTDNTAKSNKNNDLPQNNNKNNGKKAGKNNKCEEYEKSRGLTHGLFDGIDISQLLKNDSDR